MPTAALSGVTAIAASGHQSVALKSDGTVVSWGDGAGVPEELGDVIAIAAGNYHKLALKSDGTVVAWGDNAWGQLNVPEGLSEVTAIAGGYGHSLALKSDGTVVAWGLNHAGQLNVPDALSGVFAIAAADRHSLAVVAMADTDSARAHGFGDPCCALAGRDHKYVTVQATVTATDEVDPTPTISVDVTSNELDDGSDDGNTVNDIVIVDQDAFQLRAERCGVGSGRIYTITYTATDASGNLTTESATVTVPLEW